MQGANKRLVWNGPAKTYHIQSLRQLLCSGNHPSSFTIVCRLSRLIAIRDIVGIRTISSIICRIEAYKCTTRDFYGTIRFKLIFTVNQI